MYVDPGAGDGITLYIAETKSNKMIGGFIMSDLKKNIKANSQQYVSGILGETSKFLDKKMLKYRKRFNLA